MTLVLLEWRVAGEESCLLTSLCVEGCDIAEVSVVLMQVCAAHEKGCTMLKKLLKVRVNIGC
jgi:hypothetical protein